MFICEARIRIESDSQHGQSVTFHATGQAAEARYFSGLRPARQLRPLTQLTAWPVNSALKLAQRPLTCRCHRGVPGVTQECALRCALAARLASGRCHRLQKFGRGRFPHSGHLLFRNRSASQLQCRQLERQKKPWCLCQ